MKLRLVLWVAVAISSGAAVAAAQQSPAPAAKAKPSTAKSSARAETQEGERRFETHCGRCHVPPESLSPGEAKTVVRQMRVRANLTAEDERLILKYLAP
jgi:cytochrome c5